jgi:hypothetical protein
MKIGPTLAPAFAIENYNGLEKLDLAGDTMRILWNYWRMLFSGEQRKIIIAFLTEEVPKMSISRITRDVSQIHEMNRADFTKFHRPGIRA